MDTSYKHTDRTTTTTTTKRFTQNRSTCWLNGERGSGAALRRRERRLRAWQRHVRTAVQLALAEKLHHSANKVELDNALGGQEKRAGREEAGLETHSGLRAPTPLPPETRPEPLEEPLHWFILGLEASLSLPVLADRAADGVDSSSLLFLTASALEARREEEEERRTREEGSAAGSLHASAGPEDH